jgi:DNA repair exonuclease SbcCD nuclease subunit
MTNLFKKVAVFTDIHFGLKSNSQTHNDDCLDFVKWATAKAQEEGCETCMFLGDWHNNRASLNIVTLTYSLRALEHMNDNFTTVYFIPGNHDLYYRDKRDIQSVEWAKHLPNVQICNDWFSSGDVVIAPWLCGDDHKRIPKLTGKYMFGHFELPGYYMNAMVQMPDHGQLQTGHFQHQELVFTGHFHKRQQKGNVVYIGNAFPHNYADAGDDDRGMMIMDWGGKPEYHSWPDQPIYRTYKLSQIIDTPDKLLREKMHCRVTIDLPITFEEANFIKEQFMPQYKLRELMLIPEKVEVESAVNPIDITFESVDTIVMNQINNIDSDTYDKKLLLDIYNEL